VALRSSIRGMVTARLNKPVYESLPLLWALCGLASLAGSYAWRASSFSGLLGLAGLVMLVLAIAVWMHRRDYRATAADYRLRGQSIPGLEEPAAPAGSRPPGGLPG
jgi:hypothetical protein